MEISANRPWLETLINRSDKLKDAIKILREGGVDDDNSALLNFEGSLWSLLGYIESAGILIKSEKDQELSYSSEKGEPVDLLD